MTGVKRFQTVYKLATIGVGSLEQHLNDMVGAGWQYVRIDYNPDGTVFPAGFYLIIWARVENE